MSGSATLYRRRRPAAYDPGNAAKLAAAQALGEIAKEAGLSLVQLATAFVLRHPGVSSAVVGPRTLDHLEGYLTADGVRLADDVLDRIDTVVAPAATINVADTMWQLGTRALQPSFRRRA